MERIKEILKRKAELANELKNDGADLDAIEKELRELNEEQGDIEKRQRIQDELKDIESGKKEARAVETFNVTVDDLAEAQDDIDKEMESRGKALLEKRAVTVSSGDLVLPKHDKGTVNDTFNQVSTLVDRVQTTPLQGGESYTVPYEVSHGEGAYTAEGAPYFDVDMEFGYADIAKTKITAYSEVTEEVEKLPKADYARRITDGVRKAVRKKIAKTILTGTGATGEFVGIFSANATAINPATDVVLDTITEDTLDDIIYSYGGDEDVEDEAVLILSKDDLRKFAQLRIGSDNRKAYEVVNNGNTGTINGVRYVINSAAGSSETALADEYLMAYGPLSNYEMGVFSPLEVKRSDDVKFKEGMIAHRASVFAGGNVVAANGFLRVKKGAPAV